jgi:uncharacterized membrane protein YidH (DUF202 family)
MARKAKKENKSDEQKHLHIEVVRQMLTLATSGFGLVSALAWNELVKAMVEGYIKPYLPEGSQVISLLIYALIVTILAVLVTLQLSKLVKKVDTLEKN